MAINTTPKEITTGDGNPSIGAINCLDFPTRQRLGKAFETLRAAFLTRDHALHRTFPADGPVTYWVERWALLRYLPTVHDVAFSLAQIGGRV